MPIILQSYQLNIISVKYYLPSWSCWKYYVAFKKGKRNECVLWFLQVTVSTILQKFYTVLNYKESEKCKLVLDMSATKNAFCWVKVLFFIAFVYCTLTVKNIKQYNQNI